MKDSITITSKGQTTLPAPLRKKLGLGSQGGVLRIHFNEQRGELIISKPLNLDELSSKLTGYIKPGSTPVTDVNAYYQAKRSVK
jgi:bifunctional DNA-binding transcriptional regulator/antitoxin component of YhaV-PrlF toxin-antitoxin module